MPRSAAQKVKPPPKTEERTKRSNVQLPKRFREDDENDSTVVEASQKAKTTAKTREKPPAKRPGRPNAGKSLLFASCCCLFYSHFV